MVNEVIYVVSIIDGLTQIVKNVDDLIGNTTIKSKTDIIVEANFSAKGNHPVTGGIEIDWSLSVKAKIKVTATGVTSVETRTNP